MNVTEPWGPMEFPGGQMLTVLREPERDAYGDATGPATEHQIGPCAISRSEGQYKTDGEGPTDRHEWSVTAPPDSDVKPNDRVRFPDGETGRLTGDPVAPVNPFTGWAPFIKFRVSGGPAK